MTVYFKLYSDLSREAKLQVHPFNTAMKVFLNPDSANPIEIGEWFNWDTTLTTMQMTRAGSTIPSYCYYLERGRPEPQILGKGSFLFTSNWIADTMIMDDTGTGVTLSDPLKVGTVAIGGLNKSGLVKHNGSADTGYVVGYPLLLSTNNGGYLKFQALGPYRIH